MATNYDAIASEYQASKLMPWRKHIEAYTYFNLIGDLTGKDVLDLACGDGFYTRQFKLRGASNVVGVDLSAGMIALAEELEKAKPLSLTYVCCDAAAISFDKQYDLICASYLLNYAHDEQSLKAMCDAIFKHLKPGGRFITINSNPDYRGTVESLMPYRFTRENKSFEEGAEIIYRFYQSDDSFVSVTNFHLERATYNRVLASSGLNEIAWHTMELSKEGEGEFSKDFWDVILNDQPVVGISCRKAG
jgi:ubiquinone/menaquinone biosynthesis C-methylase UbiE